MCHSGTVHLLFDHPLYIELCKPRGLQNALFFGSQATLCSNFFGPESTLCSICWAAIRTLFQVNGYCQHRCSPESLIPAERPSHLPIFAPHLNPTLLCVSSKTTQFCRQISSSEVVSNCNWSLFKYFVQFLSGHHVHFSACVGAAISIGSQVLIKVSKIKGRPCFPVQECRKRIY